MNSPYIFIGIQYMNNKKFNKVTQPIIRSVNPKRLIKARQPSSGLSVRPSQRSGGKNSMQSVARAYATGQSTSAPKIIATRDSCRIVHRELVASVVGTANFTVPTALALNPGLATTFPWLSTQAQNWEQYRFNSLKACYYTRTGSETSGSVQLVPDYDAADSAPISEQIASSYEDVQEDAPWKDICCTLRPQAMFPMGPKKFIRSASLSSNLDVKTYDAGTFFLCTTDGVNATNWGKLWLEYDVILYTPQINPGGYGSVAQHLVSSVAPTTAANFGTPVSTGPIYATVAANIMTFNQSGTFLIVKGNYATTSSTVAAYPAISASGSIIAAFGNTLGNPGVVVEGGTGTADFVVSQLVKVVNGTTLTFDETWTLGLNSETIIVPINASFV